MYEFLNYSRQINLCQCGDLSFAAGGFKMDCASAGPLHILAKDVNAGLERIALHYDGEKLPRDPAHRLHDVFEVGVHLDKECFRFGRIETRPIELIEIESEDRQLLDEVVVKF